mgnify:CR=1 FL=1
MGWALIMIGCMVAAWLINEAAEKWISNLTMQCNVTIIGLVIAMICVACAGVGAWMYPQNHKPDVTIPECQELVIEHQTLYWHEDSKTLYCPSVDFWQTERDYQLRAVTAEDTDIRTSLEKNSGLYAVILEHFPTT